MVGDAVSLASRHRGIIALTKVPATCPCPNSHRFVPYIPHSSSPTALASPTPCWQQPCCAHYGRCSDHIVVDLDPATPQAVAVVCPSWSHVPGYSSPPFYYPASLPHTYTTCLCLCNRQQRQHAHNCPPACWTGMPSTFCHLDYYLLTTPHYTCIAWDLSGTYSPPPAYCLPACRPNWGTFLLSLLPACYHYLPPHLPPPHTPSPVPALFLRMHMEDYLPCMGCLYGLQALPALAEDPADILLPTFLPLR